MAIDPNLITTKRVGELPTSLPTLTSKLPHEVGTDLNYFTISELVSFIAPLVSALDYQVIELDVPQQFIIDNFDVTGLGINLMVGYAICNGNNGTKNRDGRVSIGYGTNYSTVGMTGGNKDAVVVSHTHNISYTNRNASGSGSERVLYNGTISIDGTNQTEASGVSGVDKNMPPFIVTLTLMKLPV